MPRRRQSQEGGDEVKVDLTGVAEAWEGHEGIRRGVLASSSLLQWLGPKQVGVVTMETLKKNIPVMMEFLKLYLPQVPEGKTCNVEIIKEQVGVGSTVYNLVLVAPCYFKPWENGLDP